MEQEDYQQLVQLRTIVSCYIILIAAEIRRLQEEQGRASRYDRREYRVVIFRLISLGNDLACIDRVLGILLWLYGVRRGVIERRR